MRVKTLIRSLRSERGVALPVAVAVLMAAGALAGAAATAAMDANSQSSRDKFVKRAVASADAGLDVAVYRMNKLATVLTTAQPCVNVNASTGVLFREAAQGDGWCRAQTETVGDGASYSYRVSNIVSTTVGGQAVLQRKIVSTGTSNGVQRRVATAVSAPSGTPLFDSAVFSHEDLSMRAAARIDGNARSNGNIVTQAAARVCGNVTVGAGKQFRGGNQCSGYTSTQAPEPYVMSPVVVPTTNLDNWRLSTGDDPSRNISWDAGRRTLAMDSNDTLTLNGGTYVFCSLVVRSNARITIPDDGTPVKIYIDAPERCPGVTNAGSVSMDSSAGIVNESEDPTMAQMYVAGSPRTATTVALKTSDDLHMVIYAPNSSVTMESNTELTGAIIAKKVTMGPGSPSVTWDPRVSSLFSPNVPLPVYTRQSWVECRSQSGATPDAGC